LLETALIRSAKSASVVDLEKILKKLTSLKLELGGGDAATTASPVRQSIASTTPPPATVAQSAPAAATPIAPAPATPSYSAPAAAPQRNDFYQQQRPIIEEQPKQEKSQLDDLESDIALRKRVEKNPLVQEVLSKFGGAIRGVKK
jgi:hypothetical protein